MTIAEIEQLDRDFLSVQEVAECMRCEPQLIRDDAGKDPKYLGFPITKIVLVQDERQARSIERFFRSKYFTNISRINPQWLIVHLKEKYESERKNGKKPVGRPRREKLP